MDHVGFALLQQATAPMDGAAQPSVVGLPGFEGAVDENGRFGFHAPRRLMAMLMRWQATYGPR